MKQQFAQPHRYTIVRQTETNLIDPTIDEHLSMLCFYENIRRFFFVDTEFLQKVCL